jgi:DNA (cytosine-5)-methyltransferase 1
MNQTTIFDVLYPKYKITKPIRLIELFAGYGSQALALKYLGVKFEHWKICEWAVKSIQAYKDMHFTDDTRNYSEVASKEEIQEMLFKWGISSNYNEPMTREQINRLSEEQLRTIFNNISATNNLVNIQDVKGDDLAIVNKDEYDYILTYSFPCQDLSLAGKGKGMADTSTRSGMLWEVERILNELKTTNSLPQILLMENVPQVHGSDNVEHFNKWQLALEKLGYKNYFQDLIATDYGIPQTRNRCFMVSILGEYSYTFPKPIPLELKLKDLLEKEVDEKYYLSDKQIKCLSSNKVYKNGYIRGNQFKKNINPDVCTTITASSSDRASDTFISIKNATKKGYLEATDGDGINLSNRMEHQRGNVQKDKIQTLTTSGGNDRGVVISNNLKKDLCNKLIKENKVQEYDIIKHSYTNQILNENKKCVEKTDGNMITLTTRGDCYGVCVNDENQTQLRIRKLTPLECFRLMGVKDEDYHKIVKNQSNSSLYHLAGDSICTSCLMALFSQLLDISWEDKLWNIKNSTKVD